MFYKILYQLGSNQSQNDKKEADVLFHGGNPDSYLRWPLCLLGQLKIVQVSTIEANLCRWDVCSTAVVAAGMNVVSGHFNRACKPLLHQQSLPEMSTPQTVFPLDCLFLSSQSVSHFALSFISQDIHTGVYNFIQHSYFPACFDPLR